MTFQQKMLIVSALAALTGIAVVAMRVPYDPPPIARAKARFEGAVATYLALIAIALLVVGYVSHTMIRHVIQIEPLILALLLLMRRSALGPLAAMPLFAFWFLVMGGIWLFLLGIARVFTGTYSRTEIVLTMIIGAASAAGMAAVFRQGTSVSAPKGLFAVLAFAVLQCAAMWLSVQPFAR
jgi:hypothetical protein